MEKLEASLFDRAQNIPALRHQNPHRENQNVEPAVPEDDRRRTRADRKLTRQVTWYVL